MANLTVYVLSTSFAVLFKCWKASPDDRPTFEMLSTTLGSLLDSAPGYMDNSIPNVALYKSPLRISPIIFEIAFWVLK